VWSQNWKDVRGLKLSLDGGDGDIVQTLHMRNLQIPDLKLTLQLHPSLTITLSLP